MAAVSLARTCCPSTPRANGPEGDRAGLTHLSLELGKWLRAQPGWQVGEIFENVASRDRSHCDYLSAKMQVRPYFFDAGEFSWCRRPRLFWLKGIDVLPGPDLVLEDRLMHGGFYIRTAETRIPNVEAFLNPGAERCEAKYGAVSSDPDRPQPFYTFTRPIPRLQPPYLPAGLDRASSQAISRWKGDAYRVQPYEYDIWNPVKDAHGPRRLKAVEQARMLGFVSNHFAPLARSIPKKDLEDVAGNMCGNAFSAIAIARLVAGFALGPSQPVSLSQLWQAWESLEAEAVADVGGRSW